MNRHVRTAIVSSALPLAGGSSATAALLFDQYGGTSASRSFVSSQAATLFASQAADDFSLAATGTVRKIRFWGGCFNGTPAPISSFKVLVYADAGGRPTGTPGDPTGTALHSFTVSATVIDTGVPLSSPGSASSNILRYDVNLGAGFLAAAGTTYWLAIQAAVDFPPQWGWATASTGAGDPIAQWMPVAGLDTWQPSAASEHTQFQLFSGASGAVPLPGAAGLAIVGLVGLTGRRRR